jgi:hypothetical protein
MARVRRQHNSCGRPIQASPCGNPVPLLEHCRWHGITIALLLRGVPKPPQSKSNKDSSRQRRRSRPDSSKRLLCPNGNKSSRRQSPEGCRDCWDQGLEVAHSVGRCRDEEYAKRKSCDVLLFGQSSILCEEATEFSLGLRQELAVLNACPASAGPRVHLVADQKRR